MTKVITLVVVMCVFCGCKFSLKDASASVAEVACETI